jgi:site-specific recombinase XerD
MKKFQTVEEVVAAFETATRAAGLSRNTRRGYTATVQDFASLLKAGTISGPQAYFDFLSTVRQLSPQSVWHALNPLKFLYEKVLEAEEFGTFQLPRRNKNRRIPCELSHADIINILCQLGRIERLQASLLYGCGLRVESDMLKLRLKDIHLDDRVLVIQTGKGDKSRALVLPESLIPDLEIQLRACRKQWEKDRAHGIICPVEEDSLMRKFGRKTFGTLPWYHLFPSRVVHDTPRGKERWHATDKRLASALKSAAEQLGIMQRVNPHAVRHSYATNLLRSGVDIRTIQQQLGHSSVETTEIYAHATGAKGVPSPLDAGSPAPLPTSETIIPFPVRRTA